MAGMDATSGASQGTTPKSFLSRVLGVFIEPGETFEDIARKPDWIAPLALLIVVGLGVVATFLAKIGATQIVLHSLEQSGRAASMDPAQLSQMAERSASVIRIVMPMSAVVGVSIFLLVVAGFGLLVLNGFFGQHSKFKNVFSVTCYAYLPSIVGALMAVAVVFFGDPAAFNSQSPAPTNPGFFMNPLTSSRPLMALATSLDVIIFWFLILLAMGLSRVVWKRVKAGTIFITYLGAWALVVIIKVGFAMLFAGH